MSFEVNAAIDSFEMEMKAPSPPEKDRAPTPPPKEWRAAALPSPVESTVPASVPTLAPLPPRLKKKVPWNGKNILVLLPWDDDRGKSGKAPMPMTEKDVVAMFREWEALGYDINGFNLGPGMADDEEGAQGQSRTSWPLLRDVISERAQRSFKVSIPDKKEWDDYVQELKEAKLRALGVSTGDEDPATTSSPTVSNVNMSRRTSTQYPPLPFSPPIPTSSASSSHIHQNLFSPGLVPGAGISTSQSSNPGSTGSPASMNKQTQAKYNPRQSISIPGGEHPFGSPFQYTQQQSPGVWSPSQMLLQHGEARGASPSLQNFGSIVSPVSPFAQEGYFLQPAEVMQQIQQRQNFLQSQLSQHQLQLQVTARSSPRLQEVKETEDEDENATIKSYSKTPEAREDKAISVSSLQEVIDAAEYHLESQIQRELEHEDYSPHSEKCDDTFKKLERPASQGLSASRYVLDDIESGPMLHHPQPHIRGHSLSQRPFQDSEDSFADSKNGPVQNFPSGKSDLSDIDTNPSNIGTPFPDKSTGDGHHKSISVNSNPWADEESNRPRSTRPKYGSNSHGSKTSVSKLNVAAKEFAFNPTSTFKATGAVFPTQFSFDRNNFQPSFGSFSAFSPVSATLGQATRVIPRDTNPSTHNSGLGSSEFNFSTAGLNIRPEAPTFTPQVSNSLNSVVSGNDAPRNSIFCDLDLTSIGMTKPSKKSKAIRIVHPDSITSRKQEDEVMEGKDGRITQGEGRIKRVRGGKDGGDSVPLFAEPTMPFSDIQIRSPLMSGPVFPREEDDPVLLPDCGQKASTPPKSHSRNISEDSRASGIEKLQKLELREQKQADDLDAAKPSFVSRSYGSDLPAYDSYSLSNHENKSPVAEQLWNHKDAKKESSNGHKKSSSSLSATAKPFEFKHSAFNLNSDQCSIPKISAQIVSPSALITSKVPSQVPSLPNIPLMPKLVGLSGSRFARSPTPPAIVQTPEFNSQTNEATPFQAGKQLGQSPDRESERNGSEHELTSDNLDKVMCQHDYMEPRLPDVHTREHQPSSPGRRIQVPDLDTSSPIRLIPQDVMRSDAPSPSPKRFRAVPGEKNIFTRLQEDSLVADSHTHNPDHNVNSAPQSEWDDILSENEDAKLQTRAQFFDNHVNSIVGGILDERLGPLEQILLSIQMSLDMMTSKSPSHRDRRSISGALSDADDEDEEINLRQSHSPRRDKKLEKIKVIVQEVFASNKMSQSQIATAHMSTPVNNSSEINKILQAVDQIKCHIDQSSRPEFRDEDLRYLVEDAIGRRLSSPPKPIIDEAVLQREAEYKIKISTLEQKLVQADADNTTRIAGIEDRLRCAEARTEDEVIIRRAAEDRLIESQRALRMSLEEKDHLREDLQEQQVKMRMILDDSGAKVRTLEEEIAKTTMRISLLEAAQTNSLKNESDLQNQLHVTESDLRSSSKEIQRWQMEAERALDAARRHSEDAEQANETNKELRRTIEGLKIQMEESIRVREGIRGKLIGMQEDMARAAREVADDNSRYVKKEQELIARHEVLDARLQAEARTRERLETEIERLERGEREGMRAVSECKKLEILVSELREESHKAQKDAMRYQREFQEARESGLSEVQRTTRYMQAEIESANNQVNITRDTLEHRIASLRAEIDNTRMEADTARVKSEMLIEEAEMSKKALVSSMEAKIAETIDDLKTQHKRLLHDKLEDAQRHEQHLLERLSLSSAKTEHLQDRVVHLEEKLEIANAAAAAAAAAAKTARSISAVSTTSLPANTEAQQKLATGSMDPPGKISPQALRESIMVLQEQLQDREGTIESLKTTISSLDLDAPVKISKRDDEITWLRELLAVRKSDLTDIVQSLEGEQWDGDRVRDAAIRLRANLQMEEQERERAMNGGSALNLPNMAASLRDVASPRVAQAVGPFAAAWGNWRKGRVDAEPLSRESISSGTPPKHPSKNNILGGLLTPPASIARHGAQIQQPTAFGSTGQRFTTAELANRPRMLVKSTTSKNIGVKSTNSVRNRPNTPPMLRKGSYDCDAREREEEFSENRFADEDGSGEGEGSESSTLLSGCGAVRVSQF